MSRIVRRPAEPPSPPVADPPLVSCLTITRGRPAFLRRAVAFYDRQSWPRKELVVVVDRRGDVSWVDSFFASLERPDIRWDVPAAVEHLGALRNRSVDLARGEFIAVWDDDDWYHPARLETQVRTALAENADACFLTDGMHYFADSHELFLTRWWDVGLPPSMLCRRTSMPRYTERLDPHRGQRGSDTLVQNELLSKASVTLLTESPFLYSYVYHGENVWNRSHHIQAAFHLTPSDAVLQAHLPGLRARLAEYYPEAVPESVMSRDGGQFALA